jgi:hypothetical protein
MSARPVIAALSTVEVEMVRDMRSRLNRRAVSDAAALSLGTAFFTVCTRVEIAPLQNAPVDLETPHDIARAAESASMGGLRKIGWALFAAKQAEPKSWIKAVAAGAPQAILSRRLALAGREAAVGEGAA